MRGSQVSALLEETRAKAGNEPWGIEILGFVPVELREEQLAEVLKYKPPYALIAGRPAGPGRLRSRKPVFIPTAASLPGVTAQLSRCRRSASAIFEGRECGGHVGPRTSFVLWESMIRVILAHLSATGNRGEDHHVLRRVAFRRAVVSHGGRPGRAAR